MKKFILIMIVIFPYCSNAIEFNRFDVIETKSAVLLAWDVSNAEESDGFSIERSSNGIVFETIGFVVSKKTKKNMSYIFKDENLLFGKLFYRVVAKVNGQLFYSKSNNTLNHDLKIQFNYNPFLKVIKVDINSEKLPALKVRLINSTMGNEVLKFDILENEHSKVLDCKKLPRGNYYLVAKSNEFELTQGFIVER